MFIIASFHQIHFVARFFDILLFFSALLAQQQMHPSRNLALEKLPLQARMKRKRNRREVWYQISGQGLEVLLIHS